MKPLLRVTVIVAGCLAALCSTPALAQEGDRRVQADPRVDSRAFRRTPEPSDLAKGNLDRVSASASQIRAVLVKDVGILVELKRWVAKEATDNGQVVEDASLTDDSIFDRLDRDAVFRSIATRLVQRYGYLLPAV